MIFFSFLDIRYKKEFFMIFAAIVAGGIGTRLGSNIPKQFLTLGNKPIIIHTVEKFLLCSKFDAIFL